jgi:hypothetical protein
MWCGRRASIAASLVMFLGMTASGQNPPIEVELDVFSGRPNPQWRLSSEESVLLGTKITSLSEPTDTPTIPDLGFRGFVLRSGARTIRVYADRIVFEEPKSEHACRDTAGIRDQLAADAARRGFAAMLTDKPAH